uniref:Uncharacterized protein n=1 Tax=Chlamydomonas euryale TaxID=1486919 RepID=A0A7R9V3C1_9CHLO|mmetsp:Transcript_17326/g.52114  ORF Transcript_17326/g.52114 Transcript_17326/m.52114 type:complete len:187 (+) Transcript_17326:165-725(+)
MERGGEGACGERIRQVSNGTNAGSMCISSPPYFFKNSFLQVLQCRTWSGICVCKTCTRTWMQDTNYVNLLSSHNIEPNYLRRSILGGIRYGKPVVFDMMDIDLWDDVPHVFDAVQPGLLQSLLNKSLLKNEAYTSLIKPADGEEYERSRYQDDRIAAFKVVLLTTLPHPNPAMLDATYVLRVMIKG